MSEDARKILCERLRASREYLGLSQEEVAQQVGLPRPAISQIENGNRRVDAIELAKLAKLYQRPVSYFTGEEAVSEPPQLEMLKRAAAELSDKDRDEVLRFAEFLRSRSGPSK
jgi:transcriptional regulator with XRE-family HTH domain